MSGLARWRVRAPERPAWAVCRPGLGKVLVGSWTLQWEGFGSGEGMQCPRLQEDGSRGGVRNEWREEAPDGEATRGGYAVLSGHPGLLAGP